MQSRLGKDDFVNSNPLLKKTARHKPFRWRVYEDYEVVDEDDGLPYLRASTPKGHEDPQCVKVYNPLIDTPRLFLDFARIAERKNPGEALSEWITQFGLLGFANGDPFVVAEVPELVIPPTFYSDKGGPGETLDAVWYEVYQSNRTLLLYEAVLNRDTDRLGALLFPSGEEPEWSQQERQREQGRMQGNGRGWTDGLISSALARVLEYLSALSVFAYPTVTEVRTSQQEPLFTVDQLTAGWGVRNLLGVMYLQFYWLVTSSGELSRCKYCGRIISYAPQIHTREERKARKPRKDKEFCDSRCRQNYHYRNRIKPGRRSEHR
jgi:hypothetical protein